MAPDQADPGPPRLRADHLLLEDRRHEGLEHDPGAADPQPAQPLRRPSRPPGGPARGRAGSSSAPTSPPARASAHADPGPQARARTAPPCGLEEQRHGSVRGPRRAPRRARRLEPERGIAGPAAVDPERAPEVEGPVDRDRSLPVRRVRASDNRHAADTPITRLGPVPDTPVSLPSTDTVRTRLFVAAPALIAAAALVTFADPAISTAPGTARTIDAGRLPAADHRSTDRRRDDEPHQRRRPGVGGQTERRHPAPRAGRCGRAHRADRDAPARREAHRSS